MNAPCLSESKEKMTIAALKGETITALGKTCYNFKDCKVHMGLLIVLQEFKLMISCLKHLKINRKHRVKYQKKCLS